MADTTFEIIPLGDAEAFDRLREVIAVRALNKPRFILDILKGIQVGETAPDAADQLPVLQSARLNPTAGTWRTQTLRFHLPNGQASIAVNRDDSGAVRMSVSMPDATAPEDATALLLAVNERFTRFNRTAAIEKALGPELAEFYRRREDGLLRLESLSQKLIEQNEQYRRQLDSERDQERQQLAADAKAGREALEALLEQKDKEIAGREQALASEKASLDLRTAEQVRRDNVKGLKATIAARAKSFTLTKETMKKRWPVHAIFIALLLVSAAVAAFGLTVPPAATQGPALWLQMVRVPGGVIGFAFAAVFYIRWNDQWFRQHADEEFRMRQLELDIDRASWVT